MQNIKRFRLFDNGGETVDRLTLVDLESSDIMNGEMYCQCSSFSTDWDTPLGVLSHDVVYPEDFHLLGTDVTTSLPGVRSALLIIKTFYTYGK